MLVWRSFALLATIFGGSAIARSGASPLSGRDIITVAAPQPTYLPAFRDDDEFKLGTLNSTNLYRYEHNATAISWNDSLATYAQNWTSDCNYHHSDSAKNGVGENIAIGYQNVTLTVDAWGDERNLYNFDKQGYAEATGHFTQLVWKATRSMGCGRAFCGNSGWYVSCNYYPPGNVIVTGVGFESSQVQKQVNQGSGYSYQNGSRGLNSGDAGVGNYTAPANNGAGGAKSLGGRRCEVGALSIISFVVIGVVMLI